MKLFKKILIILFWLLIWHFLALLVDNDILLVSPAEALGALVRMLPGLQFWQTVAGSLLRIVAGFLLGFLAAVLLGILSRRFMLLEELLSPMISLFKAVPVASFVVLFLIWWGSSFLAVAICFLVVLPNVYINTLEGLKNTDRQLLEMAEIFKMPFRNRFFYIYCPALKPFLLSSLKLSLGMSWKSGVAAEIIGTPAFSIGEQLYLSKIYLDTAGLFAWTAVVILFSFCFEKMILWLAERGFRWEPPCKRARVRAWDNPVLACECISKAYGEQEVIHELSAFYHKGETYYLKSPSGSGKTTLFRLLCGLEEADGGIVKRECRFSMVFQEDRLCEDYSALRNVEMVTGDRELARAALTELLPEETLDRPCRQLSGGMKRRVALVRAMEAESDCVLLDEPFTGMDEDTKARAESYIRERQQGRILIIATHI